MERDFPTNTSNNITCEIRGHTYVNEFTSNMSSLGITNYPQYYYLGWIRPENLPSICKTTRLGIDGTGDNSELVIAAPEYSSNIPIGYFMDANNDLGSASSVLLWERTGGDSPISFSTHFGGIPRFINKFYPEYFGMPRYIQITFLHTLYDPQGNIPNQNQNVKSGNKTFYSYQEFLQFCNGNTTVTDTFSYTPSGGTAMQMSFTFTGTDFASGTCYLQDDNESGYEARYWLTGVTVDGMFLGDNSGGTNRAIVPMFKHTMQFTFNDSQYNRTITELKGCNTMGGNNSIAIIYYSAAGITNISYYAYDTAVATLCGAPDTTVRIPVEQIKDGTQWLFYQDGVIVARTNNNAQKYVKTYCKLSDIENYVNLFVRVTKAACMSYISGMSYATNVSADNEFLAELKTGDIEDAAFRDGLRDWQYVPLEDDGTDEGTGKSEFDPTDPEDMPPYDPTPPGPENPDDPNEQPIDDNPEAGPNKNDRGKRFSEGSIDKNDYPADPSPFVKYGLFEYDDLIVLSGQLWNKPTSFFEGLSAGQEVNPMDYFISLRWYPFPFDTSDTKIKNELFLGHGGRLFVSYNEFRNNISVINFGSLKVKPFYNNFLDYLPYTKVYLFLPYCGQMELNPTVVMDKTITLKAAVDISDGSIVYQLWNDTDGQPLLIKQARVGAEIPITSINAAQMGSNIVNASLGTINQVSKTVGDIGAGASKGMSAGAVAGPEGAVIGTVVGGALGAVANTTNLISSFSNLGMASKEIVQLSGGSTGIASSGVQIVPYLIYQRPLATNPSTYGHTTGWLCNKAATIGSMNGYAVCKNVDTSNIAQATEKEKAQIKKILDSGFYVN